VIRCRLLLVVGIALLPSACDESVCDCFGEPTHEAVVEGVVLDVNDLPLEGIYTRVLYAGEARSGVGTQTDRLGRFTATARTDLGAQPDTASAWVRATQANLPPAAVVSDSVRVLLHLTRRTEGTVIVQVTLHLPVGPCPCESLRRSAA